MIMSLESLLYLSITLKVSKDYMSFSFGAELDKGKFHRPPRRQKLKSTDFPQKLKPYSNPI